LRTDERHRPGGTPSRTARIAPACAVLLAACLVVVSCARQAQPAAEKREPVVAVVAGQSGDLELRPAGLEPWFSAGVALPLHGGDLFMTGPGAVASVLLASGQRVQVGQEAMGSIEGTPADPQIRLTRGEVLVEAVEGARAAKVSSQFATAVARDATFDFKVDQGGTITLVVAGGTADLLSTAGGGVKVGKSQQSSVPPGGPPSTPASADVGAASAWAQGYASFVRQQTGKYFRDEVSRDNTETDARSDLAIDPSDAWAHVNLGRALLDAGRSSEAASEFTQALETKPDFEQALSGLAKTYLLDGKWAQAADLYGQARKVNRRSVEALFGLGQSALGSGDLAEAARWYKQTIAADPQDAAALSALGLTGLLAGDRDAALEGYRSALRIDADQANAYTGQGLLYSLGGDTTRAVTALKKAATADDAAYAVMESLGVRQVRAGMFERADAWFRRLQDAPDAATRAAGFQDSGAVYLARGGYRAAVSDLEKSVDLAPGDMGAMIDLGQARSHLKEGAAAVEAYSRAVGADQGNWYAHELLGTAYLASGSPVAALEEARRAVESNPGSWVSSAVAGLALAATGSDAQARIEFERAVRSAPRDTSAMTAAELGFLGAAYQGLKQNGRALEQFRKAAAAAKRQGITYEAQFHRYIGDVLLAMGNRTGALDEYRKAVELDPADTDARMSVASVLISDKDRKGAEKELSQAVERDPANAAVRIALAGYMMDSGDVNGALAHLEAARSIPGLAPATVANILVLEGNARDRKQEFPEAVQSYSEAVALDPARGDAWFYLAGDLERAGRPAEAKAAYQRAVEVLPGHPEWQKFYDESVMKLGTLK